jgi:hypothetical protein
VKERAVVFGASQNLVGVLAEPEPGDRVEGAPVALLWNVGIHHHVGPYRIFVDLARRLAKAGFASLRFDVAGQGDSLARRGVVEGDPAVADLQEAMAFLEKRLAAKTFAPFAFCSGVDALHALGLADPRVVAMGYIEPYAWRTRGFWLRYPRRLLDMKRWRRRLDRLRKRVAPTLGAAGGPVQQEAAQGNVFARNYPTRQQFGGELDRLAARGVRMIFMYFGGDTDVNFAGQFWEMIGRRSLNGRARVVFDAKADHILYRPADRHRAIGILCAWLSEQFQRPPP